MRLPISLTEGVVRTLGFLVKEVVTVLRQPLLVAGLVLGPFVILVGFGLGYRGPRPEFRTILVLPDDPAIAEKAMIFQTGFVGVFRLQEVTRDRERALAELTADRADVIVIVPDDVYEQIANGNRAALQVIYTETDPTSNGWVRYFGQVQTNELNRRILAEVLRQSKGPAVLALEYTAQARAEADALEADIRRGDYEASAMRIDRLRYSTWAIPTGLNRTLDLLRGDRSKPNDVPESASGLIEGVEHELDALRAELTQRLPDQRLALKRVDEIQARLDRYDALARRVNDIPIETLISPLVADLQNAAPIEPTAVAFYTPAVLALLLQHIGVTLTSLSSVRDRLLGSIELFRVSPVGAGHILLGKSLGYGLLLTLIAAALTWATTWFLGVPSLGNPVFYWLTIEVTIFSAVALGFALSAIANNESQAVQLSMLVLLMSVFFGGFFLPLNLLFPWVRTAAYLLPATYGAIGLRDVMLRGAVPDWPILLGPLALGSILFGFAWLGLRGQMCRARPRPVPA